jgi:hypothetical protein
MYEITTHDRLALTRSFRAHARRSYFRALAPRCDRATARRSGPKRPPPAPPVPPAARRRRGSAAPSGAASIVLPASPASRGVFFGRDGGLLRVTRSYSWHHQFVLAS